MSTKKQSSVISVGFGNLTKLCNLLGMLTLVAMMLLTVADVLLRYFFNSPISGGTEITELMMVCLFLGVPWCTRQGQAIKMELLVGRLSKRTQGLLDALTDTIGLVALVLLSRSLIEEMLYNYDARIGSTVLDIPNYPFYGVLALAVGLLCLVLLGKIIQNLIKGIRG